MNEVEISTTILSENEEYDKDELIVIEDDDDDDEVEIVTNNDETITSNIPKHNLLNGDIFRYYYGTEDQMNSHDPLKYLGVSVVNGRSLTARCTILCPICNSTFNNYMFMRHAIEHFEFEYSFIDSLLLPKASESDLSVCTNDISMMNSGSNYTDLNCEICNVKFSYPIELAQHLQSKHCYKDMPYECPVCCLYRTSFFGCFLAHFNKHHSETEDLLCLICLQIFSTETPLMYLKHIEKHCTKKQFYCDKCQLRFLCKNELMNHRTINHNGINALVQINPNFRETRSNITGTSSNILPKKSLNVGQELSDLSKLAVHSYKLPPNHICVECYESISNPLIPHFNSINVCKKCGFTTRCYYHYKRHHKSYHNSLQSNKPNLLIDFCNDSYMICPCGYSTVHGNQMAEHVNKCSKSNSSCTVRSREDPFLYPEMVDDVTKINKPDKKTYLWNLHLQLKR